MSPELKALLIIPAHNEEKNIASVVSQVRKAEPGMDILVVDDASTDSTGALVREAGVPVIRHPFNLGYGAALQTGYKYAVSNGYELVVQMDGDGQHSPLYIMPLMAPVSSGEWDIAIGSRFLGAGDYRPTALRGMGMMVFRLITTALTGEKTTDPTSGFQAIGPRALDLFVRDSFPYDYPDADVIVMAHRAGLRFTEVPVEMFPDESGKSMHSGLKPLYYLFKMFLSLTVMLLRKPEKIGR